MYIGNFKTVQGVSYMDGEGTYQNFAKGSKKMSGTWIKNVLTGSDGKKTTITPTLLKVYIKLTLAV